MKSFFSYFSLILFIGLFSCSGNRNPQVTSGELLDHIKYLSSDSLKGRQTGSAGDSLAAEYIRTDLASSGFKPLSGDGMQRLKVTDKVIMGNGTSFSVNGSELSADKDFTLFAFSENSSLEAEVVFAGYGFNITTDSLKWNDYNGINVKGKWIMILRADPEPDNTMSKFVPFSGDRDKALLAKDMGAAGVIFVSGTVFDPQDTFEPLVKGEYSVGIPAFRIKREAANIILSKSKTKIEDLEKKLNKYRRPSSFATGIKAIGKSEIIREKVNTRNVMMLLPGTDERLKNEYIIIGGHFDHLGMGGPGSPSRAVDTVAVHHGADDNASGIAMMLEIAERFAHKKNSHKRSIICLAFTGEEMGLLGSKYFTDNPGIDLSKVDVMINIDMVGRLKETNDLQIGGVGTADSLKNIVISKCDTNTLKLTLSEEGYGPSDHSSFYGRNIPVLFITTGAHLDYHTPSDTYDKINYKGMVRISHLIWDLSSELACLPGKLKFKEAGPKVEVSRGLRRKGVTLGIMPDFAGNVKNGLRADFVTPGRPAAIGGMKKGDIITSIDRKPVNNIMDYMYRLNQLKHGQTITVEVIREGKKEVLLIQL
jgi:hypothetical protein